MKAGCNVVVRIGFYHREHGFSFFSFTARNETRGRFIIPCLLLLLLAVFVLGKQLYFHQPELVVWLCHFRLMQGGPPASF